MTYLLYSFLFFFVGLVFSSQKTTRKIYIYYLFFGIVLFWGLSYIHAVDTEGYITKFYYDIQTIGGQIDHQFEIGYTKSAMIAKTIIPHYWFYQFIVFGIEIWLIFWGLRKFFGDEELMFILPLLFFLYPSNLAAFRQGMVISIFIFALHYIIDEKFKKSLLFFVFILIATLFHQSAIILILVYFARYMQKILSNEWIIFLLLAVVDIIWITGSSLTTQLDILLPFFYSDTLVMGEKYAQFIENGEWGTTYGIAKAIEINATVIMYVLFCKKDKGMELFRLNIMLYALFGLAFGGMIAHRLNYYWALIYYTCLIQAVVSFLGKVKLQVIAYLLIAVYMIWFHIFNGGLINSEYSLIFGL